MLCVKCCKQTSCSLAYFLWLTSHSKTESPRSKGRCLSSQWEADPSKMKGQANPRIERQRESLGTWEGRGAPHLGIWLKLKASKEARIPGQLVTTSGPSPIPSWAYNFLGLSVETQLQKKTCTKPCVRLLHSSWLSPFRLYFYPRHFWRHPKISLIETERKDKVEEKASCLRRLAVRARGLKFKFLSIHVRAGRGRACL